MARLGTRRDGRWGARVRRAGARATIAGAAAILLSACGVGSGTIRIGDAEAQLVAAAEAVVAALDLDVGAPTPGLREPCALATGEAGLRSRVDVRVPGTVTAVVLEAAAAALVAEGFLVVDPGVPDTLLGQRDGLSVALAEDGGVLELDGLTGCRPR
jgi:hypothetical protein